MNHVVLALTIQQADIVAAALGQLPLKVAYETFESIKQQRAQQQADFDKKAAEPPAGVVIPAGTHVVGGMSFGPLGAGAAGEYEGPAQAAAD